MVFKYRVTWEDPNDMKKHQKTFADAWDADEWTEKFESEHMDCEIEGPFPVFI